MKLFSVLTATLICAAFAMADDKVPTKTVKVMGVSEVKVVPDQATLELGVEKQSSSASLAKQSADATARRILGSLHQNGVDENDIHTTYLSLQPQFDYRKGMRISYFVAEQTMSVTIHDLQKLDAILDSLIKVGGNEINSIQYETSDLRKYRDQARELAVKAAREKAEALAHALGQEIGKAYAIEEVPESTSPFGNPYLANVQITGGVAAKHPASTATGQRTVSASIVVSFDLN